MDRLRERSSELLSSLDYSNIDGIIPQFSQWAEFAAMMRARPKRKVKGEDPTDSEESEELPSRLAYQFGRLASCLAVVEGKKYVDDGIMQTIRQVALDVAYGQTREICKAIWLELRKNKLGLSNDSLEIALAETDYRIKQLTRFLRKINCIELAEHKDANGIQLSAGTYWTLTERARNLCDQIFEVDTSEKMR